MVLEEKLTTPLTDQQIYRLILDVIEESTGHSLKTIRERNRERKIVFVRMLTMYLIRLHTTWTEVRVGILFDNRDHSTVNHAFKTISGYCDTMPDIKNTVETLNEKIRGQDPTIQTKFQIFQEVLKTSTRSKNKQEQWEIRFRLAK